MVQFFPVWSGPVLVMNQSHVTRPLSTNAGGDTDVEMGDSITAEDAYASTKAMGDQDRKVRSFDSVLVLY